MGSPSPPLQRPRALEAAGWAALLIAAFGMRLLAAQETPLWFDEIYTLWIARLPIPDLLRHVAADIHPPLHYLLAWGWRALAGEGDVAFRLLSVFAGVLGVAALVGAGRELFSRTAGWIAAALLALHPAHVAFSAEARSFALLFLMLSLSTWLAWRWLERARGRDAAAYAIVAALALYTHYLAGVVLAFVAAWGLFALRRTPRRIAAWIGLHAAVAVAFAPQLPTMIAQTHRLGADHWVKAPSAASLVNFTRLLSTGPTWMIVPLFGLALLPLARAPQRRAAGLLWCTSLAPVALLWAMSMRGAGLFVERYMFFALPSFCLLVAAGLAGLRWPAARFGGAALLLLLTARSLALHTPQPEASALARAEGWLAPRVAAGDTVVHADAHSLAWARHYHADRATHVLLMTQPALPYYEGETVIPAGWRIGPRDLRRMAAGGGRWWGFHERYGYPGAEPAADSIAALAPAPGRVDGRVTFWAPDARLR